MAKSYTLYIPEYLPLPCDVGVQVRNLVYFDQGVLKLADHSNSVKGFAVGMVYEKPTPTTAIIIRRGKIDGFAGLDPTKEYWGSNIVPGAITAILPDLDTKSGKVLQFIGYPLSASEFFLNLDDNPIII